MENSQTKTILENAKAKSQGLLKITGYYLYGLRLIEIRYPWMAKKAKETRKKIIIAKPTSEDYRLERDRRNSMVLQMAQETQFISFK